MRVTLTVHFITEYKKAESSENRADPDVSWIISAVSIIQLFVFKYWVDSRFMFSN